MWWRALPWRVHRVSAPVSMVLIDGDYILRWPAVAALAPPVLLVVGFVLGWKLKPW